MNLIKDWLLETGQKDLSRKFREIGKMIPLLEFTGFKASKPVYTMEGSIKKWIPININDVVLGRLHALYEAAGKVRVVAIVDYWTQLVLKPVHDWMFSVLRVIPTDATFDQEGTTAAFAKRGHSVLYSLDLKSATDLIPITLYVAMLSPILGSKLTEMWRHLLTDRHFLLPKELRDANISKRASSKTPLGFCQSAFPRDVKVRYTTGQPMGALSSWSSLALVHHLLVQYCAFIMGHREGWYMEYLVLGDDVVIADHEVAQAYQAILASFKIKVGLSKSYISENGMFNFANQSFIGTDNISPLSFKEELGIDSMPGRLELALRAVRRGWRDVTGGNWLKQVLQLVVTPQIYSEVVRTLKDREGPRVHPIVSWICATLFAPGMCKHKLGIRAASVNAFLAAITPRRLSLWNESLETLNKDRKLDQLQEGLLLSIASAEAERLYNEFLRGRQQLAAFPKWLLTNTCVSVEFVLTNIFQQQKVEHLKEWADDYRVFVKTLVVAIKLLPGKGAGGSDGFLIEHSLGMKLDEAIRILMEASVLIPKVPDFSSQRADALVQKTLKGGEALDAFLRTARLLGHIEDGISTNTPRMSKNS